MLPLLWKRGKSKAKGLSVGAKGLCPHLLALKKVVFLLVFWKLLRSFALSRQSGA